MTSLLLLNNFNRVISYRPSSIEKESDEIIVYGSVTRYGPRISCQHKRLN